MANYWKDAPDWARWIAWDADGTAAYFEIEPFYEFGEQWTTVSRWSNCQQHDDINKAGATEKRPEEEL